jgi:hypothetical protein
MLWLQPVQAFVNLECASAPGSRWNGRRSEEVAQSCSNHAGHQIRHAHDLYITGFIVWEIQVVLPWKQRFSSLVSASVCCRSVFFRFPQRLRNHCSAVPWLIQECRQFSKVDSKGKTLLTGSTELKPDSKTCIQISTQACLGGSHDVRPTQTVQVYQRLFFDCYIFFLLWHWTQIFGGLLIIVRELVYPHVFRCKKDICLVEFDLLGCCYSSCVTKFDCAGAGRPPFARWWRQQA